MYLDLPQANSKMYIEPQLGSTRPQYLVPSMAGLGATSPADVGNKLLTPLPPAVVATINSLPITSKQKRTLRNEPLSAFIVLAEVSKDKVIEFIKRTQAISTHRSRTYRFGSTTVMVNPKTTDSPVKLAMQFLAVSNKDPVAAARIASAMTMEIGSSLIGAAGAGITRTVQEHGDASRRVSESASKAAQSAAADARRAAEAAGKTAQQVADDARRAAESAARGVTSIVQSFNPFGCYGTECYGLGTTGGAVEAPAAAAAAGTVTMAEVTGFAAAAVALADLVVPMLNSILGGKQPAPPTQQQANAASQAAAGKAAAFDNNIDPNVKMQLVESGKILGIPKEYLYYGGAAYRNCSSSCSSLQSPQEKKR